MNNTPFPGGDLGLPPNLIPNPPLDIPEAPSAGNATASLSPFAEPQDVDTIARDLVLDRPLKLYIPNKEKYPDWEFRIINSIPQEIADAKNKGFREITDPELVSLFANLVAGTDKDGKSFRPMLFARPKKIGEMVRKRARQQLKSLYDGMNPANKEIQGKYTKNAGSMGGSEAQFSGDGWRIRV